MNHEVLGHLCLRHPAYDPFIQIMSIPRLLRIHGFCAQATRVEEPEEQDLRLNAYRLHLDHGGERLTVLWPDQHRRDAFSLQIDIRRDCYPVTVESPFFGQRDAKDADTLSLLTAFHIACTIARSAMVDARPTDPCEGLAAE